MKNKLLKDLYDCFYTPPALSSEHQEVEECHQALIKALEKPERRLVLRIIDAKDHIIADTSYRQLYLWIPAGVEALHRIEPVRE